MPKGLLPDQLGAVWLIRINLYRREKRVAAFRDICHAAFDGVEHLDRQLHDDARHRLRGVRYRFPRSADIDQEGDRAPQQEPGNEPGGRAQPLVGLVVGGGLVWFGLPVQDIGNKQAGYDDENNKDKRRRGSRPKAERVAEKRRQLMPEEQRQHG